MKYSFIIPAYNAELYIERCLNSILSQTKTNWECIIVNDGSNDNTQGILDKYVIKDNRFKVFTQRNTGPGSARNFAIEQAVGDYVVFVDSDDYIDCQYIELLEKHSESSDLIFIDVQQVTLNGDYLNKEFMSNYQNLSVDKILRFQMTGKLSWGGVRKIVRLDLIKQNKIKYLTGVRNGEEALFSFQVLEKAKSVSFISEKPIYYYVIHSDSLSNSLIEDPWGETVKAIKKNLMESDIFEKYGNTLNAFNVAALVVSIDRLSKLYSGKELKHKREERYRQYLSVYDSKFPIDTDSLVIKAKVFVPFIKIGCTLPISIASKLRSFCNKIM